MAEQPSVLVLTDHFSPAFRAGGPVRSLEAITRLPLGVRFAVLTRNRDLGATEPLAEVPAGCWVDRDGTQVLYVDTRSVRGWVSALRALRGRRFDVWYLNSLFSPLAALLPLLLHRTGIGGARRVVLAPRGEAAPGALALTAGRKAVALRLMRLLRLLRPVVWHATSPTEQDDILRLTGAPPDRVVLAAQVVRPVEGPAAVEPPAPGPGGVTRAAFLSRISPKKNLLAAVEALEHVAGPVELRVLGPVEDADYWGRCLQAARRLPARHAVRYDGVVPPEDVGTALAAADLFLFPTLSENFGHVIYEALASGCPVVVGAETPWTADVAAGCGWVVDATSREQVAAAVEAFQALGPQEIAARRVACLDAARRWRERAADPAPWLRLFGSAPA